MAICMLSLDMLAHSGLERGSCQLTLSDYKSKLDIHRRERCLIIPYGVLFLAASSVYRKALQFSKASLYTHLHGPSRFTYWDWHTDSPIQGKK